MKENVRLAIFGPPHSGKSIFLKYLYTNLPSGATAIVRTAPDGEGMYSNNPNQDEVQAVRNKGKFTDEKTAANIEHIKNETAPIVILDTGGIISKENVAIAKECNYAIVLSSDEAKRKEWEEFCKENNVELVASLDSSLEGKDERYVTQKDDCIRGKVSNLNRGEDKESSRLLMEITNKILSLAIEKSEKEKIETKGERYLAQDEVINMDDIAKELNMELNEAGNVIWNQERLPEIVEKVAKKLNGKEKAKFFGARANWLVGATTEAAKKAGIEDISYYDARKDDFNKVKRAELNLIQKNVMIGNNVHLYEALPEDKLNILLKKTDKDIFMDLELNTDKKIVPEDMEDIQLPDIDIDKNLYLSGKMPAWILSHLTLSYDNANKYVLQPGNGYYKFASENEKELGKNKKEIEDIDLEKVMNTYREYKEQNKQK